MNELDAKVLKALRITALGMAISLGSVWYGTYAHRYKTMSVNKILEQRKIESQEIQHKNKDYESKRELLFQKEDKDKIPGLSDSEIINLYSRMGYDNIWKYDEFYGNLIIEYPCNLKINSTKQCPINNLEKALESYK